MKQFYWKVNKRSCILKNEGYECSKYIDIKQDRATWKYNSSFSIQLETIVDSNKSLESRQWILTNPIFSVPIAT